MKKEFIKDKNGKVTYCNSNIAKFNVAEYIKYSKRSWLDFLFPVEFDKNDLLAVLRVLAFLSQIVPLWFLASIYNINKTISRSKRQVLKSSK